MITENEKFNSKKVKKIVQNWNKTNNAEGSNGNDQSTGRWTEGGMKFQSFVSEFQKIKVEISIDKVSLKSKIVKKLIKKSKLVKTCQNCAKKVQKPTNLWKNDVISF